MAAKKSSSTAKTQANSASVPAFLKKAAGDRLADCQAVAKMMEKATGKKAVMWGDAIVGFDTYGVKYADGRVEEWPLVAFSPRKDSITFYMAWRKHPDLLKKLGKHKTSGGCLHVKALAEVDEGVLAKLIAASAKSRKAASAR